MTQTAPGLAIASDGVSGDQDLAHDGGQGDLTGPSVIAHQAVKKVFERRGMAQRGAGGIEEGAAHPNAAVASGLAKLGLAAPPGVRRQPDQGGDLLAREQTEFGQISDQGVCGDIANTRN